MSTIKTKQQDKHFLDAIQDDSFIDENQQEEDTQFEEKNKLVDDELTKEEQEALELERQQLEEQESDSTQESNNNENNQEEELTYEPLFKELVDAGIVIPSSEDKEYDDSLDGIKEIIEDTAKLKFEELKERFINPTTSKFIEFLENGGSPDEFIESTSKLPDYANLDITDEGTAENLVRDNLTLQGYEEEEIDSIISEYKEINTLERHAKTAQRKLVEYKDKQEEELINNQKQVEKNRINNLEKEREDLKKSIYESKQIAGFEPSKAERDRFYDYLTKPIKKEGRVTTQYIEEITEEDKVKLAFLKFKKFDFSTFENKGKTDTINGIHKMLKVKKDPLSTRNNTQEQDEVISIKIPDMPWLK